MKVTAYIRDRLPRYLILASAWVLVLIFMFTFHVPAEAVIIVTALALIGETAAELWDIMRRRSYYDRLLSDLAQLDRKYLLPEMLEEPDFLDGRILCTAIQ